MVTVGGEAAGGGSLLADDVETYLRGAINDLMGLAVGLTGKRHDAEDLLQETLARVMTTWSKVARADDPDAYVRRIMINTMVSRSRRRWRSEVVSHEPTELAPAVAADPDHATEVVDRDAILGVIATLPPRQRAVVALRYYSDLPDDEIAQTLGCSRQAVRNAAHAGLKSLRGVLDHPRAPAREAAR